MNWSHMKKQLIEVRFKNKYDIEVLANLGIDIAEIQEPDRVVVVIADKDEIEKIKSLGYKFEVINPDIDTVITSIRAGTLERYHTYEQVEEKLKKYEQEYPDICSLSVIGLSFEKRPIYALKIGDKKSNSKPSCLFIGLHHAREWISVEVNLAIIQELISKRNKLTELCDVWIVPVLNPDGLVYSQTSKTMWRKNRRINEDKTIGVDLNRNYGYLWGNVGSSSNGNSDIYHGVEAFSEECTKSLKELALREHFVISVSFHSYGEMILYPYGYSNEAKTQDDELLYGIAKEFEKLTGYRAQKSSDLYPVMGDSDDWLYAEAGVLPFTVELGKEFIPNNEQVENICSKTVRGCMYLIEMSTKVRSSSHCLRNK